MTRVHELKTWPEPFAAILSGEKRHEVRSNDRGYAVGDMLHLREWVPSHFWPRIGTGEYTGRELRVRVTHLTPGGSWGLRRDICVMSVERDDPPTEDGFGLAEKALDRAGMSALSDEELDMLRRLDHPPAPDGTTYRVSPGVLLLAQRAVTEIRARRAEEREPLGREERGEFP